MTSLPGWPLAISPVHSLLPFQPPGLVISCLDPSNSPLNGFHSLPYSNLPFTLPLERNVLKHKQIIEFPCSPSSIPVCLKYNISSRKYKPSALSCLLPRVVFYPNTLTVSFPWNSFYLFIPLCLFCTKSSAQNSVLLSFYLNSYSSLKAQFKCCHFYWVSPFTWFLAESFVAFFVLWHCDVHVYIAVNVPHYFPARLRILSEDTYQINTFIEKKKKKHSVWEVLCWVSEQQWMNADCLHKNLVRKTHFSKLTSDCLNRVVMKATKEKHVIP